jgi:hypothetical protein
MSSIGMPVAAVAIVLQQQKNAGIPADEKIK